MQPNKRDIENQEDINHFVNQFYDAVRDDDLIGPIFNEKIGDQWPAHLDKMYHFWGSILLGTHQYHGRPFLPHRNLPLNKIHFERWLYLFHSILQSSFSGSKADEAMKRATLMAQLFESKIEHLQNHHSII